MSRCTGCGAKLQSSNKNAVGYIPSEKIDSSNLCERCYRIIHYNDLKMVDLVSNNDIIFEVNKMSKFTFFIVDLLNINSEVINTYKKIKSKKVLILSKIDYIPKYINKDKIKNWLREYYNINEEVIFLSAFRNFNINSLKNILEENNVKTGYIMGFTNSGKSTLINAIKKQNIVTTSLLPNTTLDFIKVKIDDGYSLIDSPGLLYENSFYENNISLIKKISPKTYIKPITYQLKKGASLVIEGLIRLENNSDKCNLTIYMNNLVDIKKIYSKNMELKEKNNIEYNISKNQDIVIKGLGFINIKSDADITIYSDNLKLIELRKSFFLRGSL